MKDQMRFGSQFGATLIRPPKPDLVEKFRQTGMWQFEYLDPLGNILEQVRFRNGITNVGVAYVYDCAFHAASQLTTWYIGLIDNSGYTALAAADAMDSHTGWNEFTTYNEATRVEWAEGATANRSITNATAASFSITGSGTIKGAFLVSNSAKSGTTGTLWSTGIFSNPPTVANGETLKVTYTLTG